MSEITEATKSNPEQAARLIEAMEAGGQAQEAELTRWRARFSTPEICGRELDQLRERLTRLEGELGVQRAAKERLYAQLTATRRKLADVEDTWRLAHALSEGERLAPADLAVAMAADTLVMALDEKGDLEAIRGAMSELRTLVATRRAAREPG